VSRRVAAAIVAGCFALSGCGALHVGSREAAPLVVVLFDVSRSTSDPEVRARYLSTFERVLDTVASEHGTIVGDVIDDDPLAHSTYPIDTTFEACDAFTDNKLVCDARTARARKQVDAQARSILASPPNAAGTDIHDGLTLAQRVFDAYPEAGARSLVLLSDMVERSTRLNVAGARFDDGSIGSTLDTFAADGLIPNLRGVSVYVVGAGALASSSLPPDRFLTIEHFWQAYLARAGANLPSDRYGAALVRFP
jgi:hypothetical protein